MTRLQQLLQGSPYQGYSYAYPHKTAYRRLPETVRLDSIWQQERRDALFLYLHVPFCEMRCGFCNLFTQAKPKAGLADRYLAQLQTEAEQVRRALGPARFARFAIGGGTPTFLDVEQLAQLFDLAADLGIESGIPMSVETSPATATPKKLALLHERGVTRISIGIQSFIEAESTAVARPQQTAEVHEALRHIRASSIPTLNIDLIYGLPGQTISTWRDSLEQALQYQPEELYLYPLYVRPLTALGRSGRAWDDQRLACYRAARDLLLERGYEQLSMRMFRRRGTVENGPVYCCQNDGMVGLGCGARSYTRTLHYSRDFAVGASGIREILADYLARTAANFAHADHGFRLVPAEQRRRFVLQSLLQRDGLNLTTYQQQFNTHPLADFAELIELEEQGFAVRDSKGLRLTEAGLERTDTIGPWLYSPRVAELMESFELR